MRTDLVRVMAVLALLGACGDRGRLIQAEERWGLIAALHADGCMGTPSVWNAYDAFTLAILRRAPATSPAELRAQLAAVPLTSSGPARTWISVRGGGEAIVTAVGLQCDFFTETGGRVTWFEHDRAGWVRRAMFPSAELALPDVLWVEPVARRVILSEVSTSTRDEIVSIRALTVHDGSFEQVAEATNLRADIFVATTLVDGVRFRHQTLLDEFSPASDVKKEYEETWIFTGAQPTVQRVPLTPWLDALDAQCANPGSAPAETVGCHGTVISATPSPDATVEVMLADVPLPDEYGCPGSNAQSITLVMESRGGAWRAIERRVTDPACARNAGR